MAVRLLHRHRPGPRCQEPLCASHLIPPVQDVSLLATDLSLVSPFTFGSCVSLDRHTKYTHARTNSQFPVSITTCSQNNLPVICVCDTSKHTSAVASAYISPCPDYPHQEPSAPSLPCSSPSSSLSPPPPSPQHPSPTKSTRTKKHASTPGSTK